MKACLLCGKIMVDVGETHNCEVISRVRNALIDKHNGAYLAGIKPNIIVFQSVLKSVPTCRCNLRIANVIENDIAICFQHSKAYEHLLIANLAKLANQQLTIAIDAIRSGNFMVDEFDTTLSVPNPFGPNKHDIVFHSCEGLLSLD